MAVRDLAGLLVALDLAAQAVVFGPLDLLPRETAVRPTEINFGPTIAALLTAQRAIDANVVFRVLRDASGDDATAEFALDHKNGRRGDSPLLAVVHTHRPAILMLGR
jgi:hypothetical protein